MKKYVALFMAPVMALDEMLQNSTPDQLHETVAEWEDWQNKHADDLHDPGLLLGENLRVTTAGISRERNEVCGYAILRASSHEVAAELVADHPHLELAGAYVDVLEWVDVSEV